MSMEPLPLMEERNADAHRGSPSREAASRDYEQYVATSLREEGLSEAAVQEVVAHEHFLAERDAAEHTAGTAADAGEPVVPLSELTDWMMERSRQ